MNMQPSSTDGAPSRIDDTAERVKQATSDAIAGTRRAVDRAAERVEAGLHHATDTVAAGAHHASDTADAVGDRAEALLAQVRDYVREKPVQSVAIALGAGWLLARLLRR